MHHAMVALSLSVLFVAGLQLPIAFALVQPSSKVVDLGYAKYESNLTILDGVTSFLGIRYAAPPTGKAVFSVLDVRLMWHF